MPPARSNLPFILAAALGIALAGPANAQSCFSNATDPNVCNRPEQQVVLQFRNNCDGTRSIGLCVTNPQGSVNGYSGSAGAGNVVRFSVGRCAGEYRFNWKDGGVPPPPC